MISNGLLIVAIRGTAIRRIDAAIRWDEKGSFPKDVHKDQKADFILTNSNGVAGFVLANGSISTSTSSEGEIRKALIETDTLYGIMLRSNSL